MLMCLSPADCLFHAAAAPAMAARNLNSAISGLVHEKVDMVKDTIEHLKSKHHQQAFVAPQNYLITQQPQYVVAAMPHMPMPTPVVAGAPTVQAPPPPPPTVEEKEVTVRVSSSSSSSSNSSSNSSTGSSSTSSSSSDGTSFQPIGGLCLTGSSYTPCSLRGVTAFC
jgi:hypothetical protein